MMACLISCDKDDENPPPTDVSTTDRNFVVMASMGNQAEIESSQLAITRGTDTSIKSFAQMMIMDHQMAKGRLDSIATDLGLYIPDSLDAEHVALHAQLDTLSGYAFDSVYINSQVVDHQENIALFTKGGQLVYHISFGTEKNLPTEIRHIVKTNYYDQTITWICQVNQNDRSIWVIGMEDPKFIVRVRVEDMELEETQRFKKT